MIDKCVRGLRVSRLSHISYVLIMLMANWRCCVELYCIECVVQQVSWLVNVQVLGMPRQLMTMEQVKCGVRVRWIRSGEGRTRWLGPRLENGPSAAHIGHWKSKSTWVMKMASTKSRRRMMVSWHLADANTHLRG
jgi:hypothetical protein